MGKDYTITAKVSEHFIEELKKQFKEENLLKNKSFCKEFEKRFEFHLNTTFNSEIIDQKINSIEATYAPLMQEQMNRWRALESMIEWKNEVNALRQFQSQRPTLQRQQLKNFMAKDNVSDVVRSMFI